MATRLFFVFLIITGLFSDQIKAQEYPAINIGIEEGSPSNTIYDVFQDSKGFIWVGTENGLARFNGKDFKTFPYSNIKSLAVTSIQEDSQGTIWMINFSGQVLYLENNTLYSLKPWDDKNYPSFPSIVVSENNVYIIQPRKAVYKYCISQKELTLIDSIDEKGQNDYIPLHRSGEIWKLTDGKIFSPINLIDTFSFSLPTRLNTYPTMTKLQDQYLVSQRYGSKKQLYSVSIDGKITDLTHDYKGLLGQMRSLLPLFGNLAGFIGLEGMIIIDSTRQPEQILKGKNIGSITNTTEDGLIAGTLDKGLFVIPSLKTRLFKTESDKGYYRIEYDKTFDRIIVGDLGGNIHFYTRKGNLISSVYSDEATEVQSLFIDHLLNKILVQVNDLQVFNLEEDVQSPIQSASIQSAKDIMSVDSTFYFATSNGIVSRKLGGENKHQLSGVRTTSIEQIADNELIIGSQKGIIIYDIIENSFEYEKYEFQQEIKDLTSSVSKRGKLYLGTETRGIFIYENERLFKHFSQNDGLISNKIYDIDVNANWIAIATDKGISLIDQSTLEITNIGREKGLQSREVTDLTLVGDQLWATNLLGLQSFELPIEKNEELPYLEIDRVYLNGQLMSFKEDMILPYDFNELAITFDVANNIHAFGQTKIYYRINGDKIVNEWNQTTLNEPTARYLSLPSGNFDIEAYAENQDGVKSTMFHFPFEVETPYWKRWWFTLLSYATVIAAIIYTAFYFFQRQNQKNQEELIRKNRIQESRIAQLTSIRAQMNPHFIFNTLSLVQGLVVEGQAKLAGQIIQDFSKLMRNVLDLSSKEMVTLQEEIDILKKYLFIENSRLNGNLVYKINMDSEVEPELIKIPSLLTQPFVENAIRHGLMHKEGNKHLEIDFAIQEDSLFINIQDNGIGREAAEKLKQNRGKTSFAIEAYKKRIQLINEMSSTNIKLDIEDLKTEHNRPAGTLVTIIIPLDI